MSFSLCRGLKAGVCYIILFALAAGGDVAEDWQQSLHHLSALRYENQHLPTMLGNMLNHKFTFPETALRKGVAYVGANHRLRRVVKELLHSNNRGANKQGAKPIKIALVGGSISWGQGATERGVTDWFSVFSRWVIQAFPAANVTLRNGCVPGTPSAYMILCLEMSMDDDADLVFVEYALNDGFDDLILKNSKTKIYERLMRRIMVKPHNPAIVMIQVPTHGMASNTRNRDFKPFHLTMEDSYGTLAQYYDLQYLSFRTAIYRLASHKRAEGYNWKDVMSEDFFHPGDGGFRLMAELAIWLLQQTAIDLLLRPFGHADVELLEDSLPLPMEEGNEAPTDSMCLHQDALRTVVNNATGFLFVNEGTDAKPKKGFVATEVGSHLMLQINTFRDGSPVEVSVFLAFLKSYNHMGTAEARCEFGCTCVAAEMDAHHKMRNSQMHMVSLKVTQAKVCLISLRVLEKTASGGHKFKLGGVMVAEQPSSDTTQYKVPDGKWGTHVHENPELQLSYSKDNSAKPAIFDPVDTEVQIQQKIDQGTR